MTGPAPQRRLSVALMELPRLVLGKPLRDGRLDWAGWSPGLRAVSLVSVAMYIATALLVLFATPIRDSQQLVVGTGSQVVPVVAVPVLTMLSLWCICLLQAAVLAAHWSLKVGGLLVTLMVISQFTVFGGSGSVPAALVGLLSFAGLVVYTIVRRRSRFHAIDILVVSMLISVGTMVPQIVGGRTSLQFGYDFRPGLLFGLLSYLLALSLPALMASGAALAQVAITTAEAVASVIRDVARRWVLFAAIGVALVVRGVQLAYHLTDPDAPSPVGAAVQLVLAAAVVALVWFAGRRSRRAFIGPGESSETWGRALYPLALGLSFVPLLMIPLSTVLVVATLLQDRSLIVALGGVTDVVTSSAGAHGVRVVVGLAALAWALLLARRGRMLLATTLACFTAITVHDLLTALSSDALSGVLRVRATPDGLALLATVGAVVGLAWCAIHRFRHPTPLLAVVALLGACILYGFRELLDDPTTALLGFAGGAAILAGLLWRVLTDGHVTRGTSTALPSTTRVLLFWANSLFGVLALAFMGLARPESGSFADLAPFQQAGDTYLGTPLFLTLILSTFATVFVPRQAKVISMSDALGGGAVVTLSARPPTRRGA
ncbi:hypothetical protein [Propionicicella superfundia]|uniref:hypothetical protein n=1 Tax=Propionicicella superfundia TaxID=348582 RepID=UPI000419B030|nr:hypothetical protein [Propionicicella superfundia]